MKTLDKTVQELVNHRAGMPIGVKFHREGTGKILQPVASGTDSLRGGEVPPDSEIPLMRSSSSEEKEDVDEMMERRGEERPLYEEKDKRESRRRLDGVERPPSDWH
ncbi:LOW QUALITY PROTEIN: Hypothetical protein PHPALM_17567 [Phytophthora palmivora]|uniref:Uncharacterized protein n=1 Tax=Phytophthora palmivora TaxID=4796 RepID=A0A2P4XLZ8_9STRA|nr:LOW QUALITY PROTEIN: Hypothetical protein PHPALM_17567 [Phytophthora palmivora]